MRYQPNSSHTASEQTRRNISPKITNAPEMKKSVTVLRSVEEVYGFWRDFSNLPKFMKDISQVEVISPTTSRWTVDLPRGPLVQWNAEIISERPGEMISWQSIGDSEVRQAGSVWFSKAPQDLGTIVTLVLSYSIPGGKLVELATKLMGEDPQTLVLINLRQFKAFMETGEIPTIDGQPSGRDERHRESETH